MTLVNIVRAMGVAIGMAVFVVTATGPVNGDDCSEAERIYQSAVETLFKPADRVAAFQEAVTLCPSHLDARLKLGDSLRRLKKPDEAILHYEKALHYHNKEFKARVELAKLYCLQGRYEMARHQCEAALALQPGHKAARRYLDALTEKIESESGSFRKSEEITRRVVGRRSKRKMAQTYGNRTLHPCGAQGSPEIQQHSLQRMGARNREGRIHRATQ